MEQAWATVIGMSIAYVASFLGMGLAWYGWKKRHADPEDHARTRAARPQPPEDLP